METPVRPGIIIPEVVEQVIVVIMVVDLVTNIVRPVTQLLLTLGASIPATLRQVGTKVAAIVNAHRLPVSTIGDAILPVIRGEVSILSTRIAQIRSSVGPVTDSITSIIRDGTSPWAVSNSIRGRTCSVA